MHKEEALTQRQVTGEWQLIPAPHGPQWGLWVQEGAQASRAGVHNTLTPHAMTVSSSYSPSTAPRGEGGPLRPCPGKEAAVGVRQLPRDPRSPVRPVLCRETQYVTFPARPRCKDPDRDDTHPRPTLW